MLIKTQFKNAFLMLAASIALSCVVFVYLYVRWNSTGIARTWAHEVVRRVFECNVLGSEYVTQSNGRAKEQFDVSNAELTRLLANPPKAFKAEKYVKQIQSEKEKINQLVRRYEESAPGSPARTSEWRRMLNSQMALQATGMSRAAQVLYIAADGKATRLRRWMFIYILSALVMIGVVTGSVFRQAYKNLVWPLHQLAAGAQRLGAGELNYRLGLKRADELGMLAASFDQMAEQLARRQTELEEKLKDLDTFCYSIAHDLKAPLRTVAGFGELLEEDHRDDLGAEGRAYVDAMRKATVRMAALIDDLLEYGALTHKEFALTEISLEGVVAECLKDLEPEIRKKNGRVEIRGKLVSVMGNRVIVKQALYNLLINALKFVPGERTPEIVIETRVDGTWCKVMVKDNGIGIAPEHQKKIFGLFQRLHSDSEYPGTGIGLAMVEKGIHLMGGFVGVESAAGTGSTFWMTLPMQPSGENEGRTRSGKAEKSPTAEMSKA
jgi:signal transduction histidine kinase